MRANRNNIDSPGVSKYWSGTKVSSTGRAAIFSLAFAITAMLGVGTIRQFISPTIAPARALVQGGKREVRITCRREPLQLKPARTMINAVAERDVVSVLCGALPWWNPPTVPSAFHELKLWGRRAVFTKEMLAIERSGVWLVESLLDDAASQLRFSGERGHYLLDSPYGIRIVLMGSEDATRYRAQAHYGQLLKVLGEVGVSASQSVTTSSGRRGTVEDIIRDELMQYVHSGELDFIATALAYWLPPQRTWRNQFDEEFSFDSLMQQLLEIPWGKGSCGGCHVPYSVVCLLRADEIHQILAPNSRIKGYAWLNKLMGHLEQKWAERGPWDKYWGTTTSDRPMYGDDLLDRITITGHHLEWIAMLPVGIPPDETLVKRAVQCLCADVDALPPVASRTFKTLLPISHAGRALALLRGVDPFEAWREYWETGQLRKDAGGYSVRRDTETKAQ